MTRLAYIDNIRWSLIILVLSMHASDTYSPFGNWYFTDRVPAGTGTVVTFAIYQSFLQAFFMALLFFISGYFSASSLQRKGPLHFCCDRLIRLGIPSLLYALVIGPLTQYYLSHTWGRGGFAHQWLTHLRDGEWLSNSGPMWFCVALLMFSCVYAFSSRQPPGPRKISLSLDTTLLVLTCATAVATFAIRCFLPENIAILNMHPGDFPQYAVLFGLGIAAYRHRFLEWPDYSFLRRWSLIGLIASAPLMAGMLFIRYGLHQDENFDGGLGLGSALHSLWEQCVCVGMSCGLLLLYCRYFNYQGPIAKFLADNAFGVYLFHPPILIALAQAFHGIGAAPLIKAALLTMAAGAATYLAVAIVGRRIPGLRRVL